MSTDPARSEPEAEASTPSSVANAAPDQAATGQTASEPSAVLPDRADERPGREPGELVVAMSPRQIIGGFALLAGLILMLRRRRKG